MRSYPKQELMPQPFNPYNFDISKATPCEIISYIQNRLVIYRKNNDWEGKIPWEYLQDDLENFTISNFDAAKDEIRISPDHLRKKRIEVSGGSGYIVSKTLFELFQENEPWIKIGPFPLAQSVPVQTTAEVQKNLTPLQIIPCLHEIPT